eukprot:4903-Heterococcus_DN1.PRE.1
MKPTEDPSPFVAVTGTPVKDAFGSLTSYKVALHLSPSQYRFHAHRGLLSAQMQKWMKCLSSTWTYKARTSHLRIQRGLCTTHLVLVDLAAEEVQFNEPVSYKISTEGTRKKVESEPFDVLMADLKRTFIVEDTSYEHWAKFNDPLILKLRLVSKVQLPSVLGLPFDSDDDAGSSSSSVAETLCLTAHQLTAHSMTVATDSLR